MAEMSPSPPHLGLALLSCRRAYGWWEKVGRMLIQFFSFGKLQCLSPDLISLRTVFDMRRGKLPALLRGPDVVGDGGQPLQTVHVRFGQEGFVGDHQL